MVWFHISMTWTLSVQVIDIMWWIHLRLVPQEKSILCILQKHLTPAGSLWSVRHGTHDDSPRHHRSMEYGISNAFTGSLFTSPCFSICWQLYRQDETSNRNGRRCNSRMPNGHKLKFSWYFFSLSSDSLPALNATTLLPRSTPYVSHTTRCMTT